MFPTIRIVSFYVFSKVFMANSILNKVLKEVISIGKKLILRFNSGQVMKQTALLMLGILGLGVVFVQLNEVIIFS